MDLDLEKARVDKIDWMRGVGYMRDVLGWKTIPEKIEREVSGSGGQVREKIQKDERQLKLI